MIDGVALDLKSPRLRDLLSIYRLRKRLPPDAFIKGFNTTSLFGTLRWLLTKKALCYLIWEKGKLAGVISIDRKHWLSIYLDQSLRGLGIGSFVIKLILDHFNNEVLAQTRHPEFFEKCGFKRLARVIEQKGVTWVLIGGGKYHGSTQCGVDRPKDC